MEKGKKKLQFFSSNYQKKKIIAIPRFLLTSKFRDIQSAFVFPDLSVLLVIFHPHEFCWFSVFGRFSSIDAKNAWKLSSLTAAPLLALESQELEMPKLFHSSK